jgi:hypothetical protein
MGGGPRLPRDDARADHRQAHIDHAPYRLSVNCIIRKKILVF